MELPPDIAAAIDALCLEGRALEEAQDFNGAIAKYRSAYNLMPVPRESQDTAWWFFAVIGDCYFSLRDYARADDEFRHAMVYSETFGNAFIRKRRGQILLELGHDKKALEELAAAYMLDGAEIFAGEDPKYFEFVKRNLRPPASGKW